MHRHFHLKQDEYFKVEQGVLAVIVDGKEMTLTKEDELFVIRANKRKDFHKFIVYRSFLFLRYLDEDTLYITNIEKTPILVPQVIHRVTYFPCLGGPLQR